MPRASALIPGAPPRGSRPAATVEWLPASKKYGIRCPFCDYKVMRGQSYFHQSTSTERCPHCMEHSVIKLRGVK
jgi:DNA-directed RNA polymerase subunit RPC12/RpoP